MYGKENDSTRYRPGRVGSEAGIIPRAIKDLFAGTVAKDAEANVFCSFMQIYNENIYDLLKDEDRQNPLTIHEDQQNGLYVDGLSEYMVRGWGDVSLFPYSHLL
jgi:hypothetical protein